MAFGSDFVRVWVENRFWISCDDGLGLWVNSHVEKTAVSVKLCSPRLLLGLKWIKDLF